MAGPGGVWMGVDYRGVDPDRPLGAFVVVSVAAQLVEDPHPGAVS
jgi:hypothetical protein